MLPIWIPPTGYIGLIWGYFEGMLQLLWQEYHACNSCSIPSKYPQWYSNLQWYCIIWDYVAGQEESGCVINTKHCDLKRLWQVPGDILCFTFFEFGHKVDLHYSGHNSSFLLLYAQTGQVCLLRRVSHTHPCMIKPLSNVNCGHGKVAANHDMGQCVS